MAKKPSFLSAAGLAAAILAVFAVLLSLDMSPDVRAAAILQRLDEQITEDTVFDVTLDSLSVGDEIVLDGSLSVWGDNAAGDLVVSGRPAGAKVRLVADVAFAIPRRGGWILVNDVSVEDPEAQDLIEWFLPAGAPVLVQLPDDVEFSDLGSNVVTDVLALLRSGRFYEVLETLIDSRAERGARIRERGDGTMLLTLPVEDAQAAAALEHLVQRFLPSRSTVTVALGGEEIAIPGEMTDLERQALRSRLETLTAGRVTLGPAGVEIDGRTVPEMLAQQGITMGGDVPPQFENRAGNPDLVGSTIEVVYDPAAKRVFSLTIDDFGPTRGTMTVAIRKDGIDPGMLDARRAGGARARKVGFKVLEGLVAALERILD